MNNKEIHNRIKNSKKEANKIWDELFYCEEIEVSTKKSNKKNVHNTVKKDIQPVAKTKSFSYINNIFDKEKTKYKNIREKLEVTGFINENDFIEYNVSDESKMRALMQSMNISTKDKQFFPVSGNPKNKEHFKRPLYGFSWNKENVRINFDEVKNGCKRSYTIECSNRQITDLNIPSIRKKGTFGFVPPEGYVVLDIDDMLDAIFIRDYVEKNNIRCDILQTTHGIHFIFKYTEDGSIACKIDGNLIFMKSEVEEELKEAKNAIKVLNLKIDKVETFLLPFEQSKRTIVSIKKVSKTPNKYPRKFSEIKKNRL